MEEKKSQTDKLYDLLSDYKPHRTDQICNLVYGAGHLGLARVGARVFDVRKKYGVQIKGWHDSEYPTLYWYQMERPENEFSKLHEFRQEPVRKQVALFPVRRPIV